jgi:predicted nucleic acid-binding protein
MMSRQIVIYDACVLYPAPLRDVLMNLALTGVFQARWTDAIHDEWIRNLNNNRPEIPLQKLQRVRQLMDQFVPDALITGYEGLIGTLTLPDQNDRHVLAAAIHGGAEVIITLNTRDFPVSELAKYDIERCEPDAFVLRQLHSHQAKVIQALHEQRTGMLNPTPSVDEFLSTLAKNHLPHSVTQLQEWKHLL